MCETDLSYNYQTVDTFQKWNKIFKPDGTKNIHLQEFVQIEEYEKTRSSITNLERIEKIHFGRNKIIRICSHYVSINQGKYKFNVKQLMSFIED